MRTPGSTAPPHSSITREALAYESYQDFGPWVSQTIRLAKGGLHPEITYTVGPVRIADGWGKYGIARVATDIENEEESFADSIGRDMIHRQRDYRQSWEYDAKDHGEPVAGTTTP